MARQSPVSTLVEIKKDWSNRSTVGQLLEYAASYREAGYEIFNQLAQQYQKWPGGELVEKFREWSERPDFAKEEIGKRQRIFVVAPDSDMGLKSIVGWLRAYRVPIEFISFRLLADQNNRLRIMIDIAGASAEVDQDQPEESWAGHWIFNTNEAYAPGAYERMFKRGVIAVFGYENGGDNLEGALVGQRVLAYVNGQGIRALGEITNPAVESGTGIFLDENGRQQPDEYHVRVKWVVVLPQEAAISNSEASGLGYALPVRTVFGRLRRGRLAARLEEEVKRRQST